MQFFQDVKNQIARYVDDAGDVYIFDLGKISALNAIGVDERLYAATTYLSRLILLKGPINSRYYSAKLDLMKRYWALAKAGEHEQLGVPNEGRNKPSASQAEDWMKAQPDYQKYREIRDFIEDAVTALTTTYIPRLRSLREQGDISVKETTGTKPPQSPDPFPPVAEAGAR